MIAFEGDRLPTWSRVWLAARRPAGMTVSGMTTWARLGRSGAGPAVQRAGGGTASGPAGVRRVPPAHRRRPRGRAVGGARRHGHGFPGAWPLARLAIRRSRSGSGRAGSRGAGHRINVVYAPALDVASNPDNEAMGICCWATFCAGRRPWRGDGGRAAACRGGRDDQALPGLGDAAADTHYGAAVVATRATAGGEGAAAIRAGIAAGARLVMSSHVAVPALTGDPTLPGPCPAR